LSQDNENNDYLPQSISYTNESEENNLELIHTDNNYSNMELEILAKRQNDNSFNETDKSESGMNESEIANKPPTKEWKKIGRCKVLVPGNKEAKSKHKCRVLVHTQESTTNFASHLLTHGL
ncbi:11096_t:CDS:2, partial [Dentiscutata erythropus]